MGSSLRRRLGSSLREDTMKQIELPDRWKLLHSMSKMINNFLNSSYPIRTPFYIHHGIHFPRTTKGGKEFQGKMKVLGSISPNSPLLVKMFPDMPREMDENLFSAKKSSPLGKNSFETRLHLRPLAPKRAVYQIGIGSTFGIQKISIQTERKPLPPVPRLSLLPFRGLEKSLPRHC